MPFSHILLALTVVVIWGVNFLFVKIGLDSFSPLLLCALRFILASIPAIFFIKPPAVPFRMIAMYGLVMFALQFTLLFIGMHVGMTPGMASLIMQVQVFFSLFFAAFWLGEQPEKWQIIGALVSFSGIALVAMHFDSNMSFLGFLFILAAAATWGAGNLITKKIKHVNMIALVIWGSLVASVPLSILALVIDGPTNIINSFTHLSWQGTSALFYIVYASTWIGYGLWNWLISRYAVSTIVPFTLLVPVVGVFSSVVVLHEPFDLWKLIAGLLVIAGLCINLLSNRLIKLKLQVNN